MTNHNYLVPTEEQGVKKDLSYSVAINSIEYAEDWFVDAKERLLDVNNWKNYSALISPDFRLIDGHGHELRRYAKKGDHIFLGNKQYNWAIIESIQYDDYPDANKETFTMQVRLLKDFLDDQEVCVDSSVSPDKFVIERRDKHLIANYYGENEGISVDFANDLIHGFIAPDRA